MFGELLFSFDSLKLGISYKAKKAASFSPTRGSENAASAVSYSILV